MPPVADKHLEERILKAAQRLWRVRGEKAFTLRAVAREAGTTTPTLYKRFRNKGALQLAVAARVREELTADLLASPSMEYMHRRYLAFVEARPREYDLLRLSWGHFFPTPRPVRSWLLAQLATRFGGEPADYTAVYEGIFLLCHGAATLLIVSPDQTILDATREICIKNCDRLLENAALFRNTPSPE